MTFKKLLFLEKKHFSVFVSYTCLFPANMQPMVYNNDLGSLITYDPCVTFLWNSNRLPQTGQLKTNKNSSPTVLCRLVRNQGVRRVVLPLEAVGGHLLTLACSSFWWLSLPGLSLHHSNLSPWLYCLLFWCLACICITLISVSTVTLFWVNVNVSLPFSYKDMGSIDPVHI